ncbi:phage tail protein [Flexibacterium corallicola]|uniref:phage tail protein n=1 Tax=Flexibacterium corallicola TaxID=3037259 RepID=UPI00286F45A3|nr:tail fiber protein [Pseudovibrio sp. M1P-2-3]
MTEPFISQISIFGNDFGVRNWALCQGATLGINEFTALFALISTLYGGNGRTDFALPDLRARVPVQSGQGPGLTNRPIGLPGGFSSEYLPYVCMPAHTHSFVQLAQNIDGSEGPSDSSMPANPRGIFGGQPFVADWYTATGAVTSLASANAPKTNSTGNEGSFSIECPYQVVNYQIALTGTFPSRS